MIWHHASEADLSECREAIRVGSHSFYAASKLLPSHMRDPAFALYAFCRLSDDAVDDPGGEEDAVQELRARLDLIYNGKPLAHFADRALADTVVEFDMPRILLEALLEGMEWDRDGREYETISDVRAYGARVAGTVGAMMAVLMGARSPWMIARACDLGVAMQLTNIARDVGEDAQNGRLYLPREWLRNAGIDPNAFLDAPEFNEGIAKTVEALLKEADTLFRRSEPGIARLPISCRPAIWAARRIYADIGREIAEAQFNSVSRRAVTSKGRKLVLLGRSLLDSILPRSLNRTPALNEVDFLVDAAAIDGKESFGVLDLDGGILNMIDVLERVGQRKLARETR